MSAAPSVDPNRCPLCGNGNACAAEAARRTGVPQGPCWCMSAPIGAEPLDRVPEGARGRACICARCAAADPTPCGPAG